MNSSRRTNSLGVVGALVGRLAAVADSLGDFWAIANWLPIRCVSLFVWASHTLEMVEKRIWLESDRIVARTGRFESMVLRLVVQITRMRCRELFF